MGLRLPRLRAPSDELLHLDVIRFVASLGIVYHHSHEFFLGPDHRAAVMERSAGLALFVDLFFVISGFVIAYVYVDKVDTPGRFLTFMQRRAGRLLPLHWLTLVVSIAVFAVFAALGGSPAHGPSFRPVCILDTALLLHGVIPCGTDYFNGVTWSISVEMVMYAAFPLFAMLARRWRHGPLIAGLAVLALLLAHAASSGSLLSYRWDEQPAVLRGLPSFLIGIGFYQHRVMLGRIRAAAGLLALALIATMAAMLSGAPMLLVLFLSYVTAALAVAADQQRHPAAIVRRLAPLGGLTYSIYMWHGLFILLIMNVIGDKLLHASAVGMLPLAFICYGGLAVWSYLSLQFIETPARRTIDRLSPGRLLPGAVVKMSK